jgi:DNA-binding protein YbaB
VAEADEYIDQINRQAKESLARVQESARAFTEAVGEGEAGDGLVTVRIAASGKVDDLRLDPRVMRQASEDLADLIKEAMEAAHDDLQAKLAADGPAAELVAMARRMKEGPGSFGGMLDNLHNEMRTRLNEAMAAMESRRPRVDFDGDA